MAFISFDAIRLILEYTDSHLHQLIIDACRFDVCTAREYGAISEDDLKTGKCYEVSPRHANQIYGRAVNLPLSAVESLMMMLIMRKCQVWKHYEASAIVDLYIDRLYREIEGMASRGEMFETYYMNTPYLDYAPIALYSPTRFHYISYRTTLSNYVKQRGVPAYEIFWLVMVAIEKRWRLGDHKILTASFTISQFNTLAQQLLRCGIRDNTSWLLIPYIVRCEIMKATGMYTIELYGETNVCLYGIGNVRKVVDAIILENGARLRDKDDVGGYV